MKTRLPQFLAIRRGGVKENLYLKNCSVWIISQQIRVRTLVNEMAGSQARFTFGDILGVSPRIQGAQKQAMRAAAGISNVLLGETGTGGLSLFSWDSTGLGLMGQVR
jgi:transcriptional regulator with PAS, ATPase and Fis domain